MKSSILELASKIHLKKITSKDLISQVIEDISTINNQFGKVVLTTGTNKSNILQQAENFDNSLQSTQTNSSLKYQSKYLLGGIPIAVKDNFVVNNCITTAGSEMLSNFESPYSATVVNQIEDSGGIICMKTNMDEFGMGSSSGNSAFKPACINPWSKLDFRALSPGGSSSGSAVAVSCGLVPVAIGSDTGGSVRQPASFCGIVGLKPTYGLLSRHGLISYASSMDTPGIFTNSVVDAAIALDSLSRHDPNDPTSIPPQSRSEVSIADSMLLKSLSINEKENLGIISRIEMMTKNMKEDISLTNQVIGIPDEFLVNMEDDSVRSVFENAIHCLQDAGAIIKRVSIPSLKKALPCYYILACAEASSNLSRYDSIRYGQQIKKDDLHDMIATSRGTFFGAEVIKRILTGTFVLSKEYVDDYFGKATEIRMQINNDIDLLFKEQGVSCLASLTSSILPFSYEDQPIPSDMLVNDYLTVTANLCGIPAINIPVGSVTRICKNTTGMTSSELLPIGLQLHAPRMNELSLLKTAFAIEQRVKFDSHIPSYVKAFKY